MDQTKQQIWTERTATQRRLTYWVFEIYTVHPQTGEGGCSIESGFVELDPSWDGAPVDCAQAAARSIVMDRFPLLDHFISLYPANPNLPRDEAAIIRQSVTSTASDDAVVAIWRYLNEDFPRGTGPDHGTCATDGYLAAVRLVERAAHIVQYQRFAAQGRIYNGG